MTVYLDQSPNTSIVCSTGYTATHKALLVAEIAERICRHTLTGVDGPYHTCTALALTCKALYEPAMNVAWQQVSNFNRLLRCFPPDTWLVKPRCKRVKMLRAPSNPEDWIRFNQYARRVLRLTFDCRNLDPAFIRALYAYHPGRSPVFPNLRALTWIEPQSQQDITYYSRMIVGPTLEHCDMHINGEGPEISQFVEYLRKTCVDLRMFTVWSASTGLSDALDGNLPYFGHLTTLVVHGELWVATLKHLGCLPRLRELRFAAPRVVDTASFPFVSTSNNDGSKCTISPSGCTTDARFPALETLTFLSLPSDSPQFLGAFLRSIVQPYPTLHSVEIEETTLSTLAFCDAVDALSVHRALERINITCAWSPLNIDGRQNVPQVTWETLAPLYTLGRLRELAIHNADVRLTRASGCVEHLGRVWPQLERLELLAADDLVFDDSTQVDLSGQSEQGKCLRLEDLRLFAGHLPHLTHLTVPFRLGCSFCYSLPFFSSPDAARIVCAPALQQLGVLPLRSCHPTSTRARSDSQSQVPPVANQQLTEAELEALVAAYLSELFPSAHLDLSFLEAHVDAAAADDMGVDEDPAAQTLEAWKAVGRLMEVMSMVRRRAVEWAFSQ